MSTDLLETIDEDVNGNGIGLTMNVHGYAFLSIEYTSYTFEPTPVGVEKALKVAQALQEWTRHVSSNLNDKDDNP